MYNDRAGCDHETEYKRKAQDLSPAAHEADVEGTAYEKGKTQGHMKLWKPREKLFLKERSNTTLMRETEDLATHTLRSWVVEGRQGLTYMERETSPRKFTIISRAFILINTLSKWKFSPVEHILDNAINTINVFYFYVNHAK